jgi:hypothetical protein
MKLGLEAQGGENKPFPSGCSLSRRSAERQIEKRFCDIEKTDGAADKLSGRSRMSEKILVAIWLIAVESIAAWPIAL